MKNLIYFLCFGCFLIACNPTPSVETETTVENNVIEVPRLTSMEGKHCFLETLKHKDVAIIDGDTIQFVDSTIVNLEISGNKVTGRMDWIPAEKDSGRGTLEGTIDGNTVTVLYSYTIEGSDQQEEKMFEIRNYELAVYTAELEEDENMVLRIKDSSTITFGYTLPRVPCD
jgi:hypothetical protein